MNSNFDKLQINSSELIDDQNCKKLPPPSSQSSKDEVDFNRTDSFPPYKNHVNTNSSPTGTCIVTKDINQNKKLTTLLTHNHSSLFPKKFTPGTLYGDCEVKTSIKSSLSTLEKLSLFNLAKKKFEHNSVQNGITGRGNGIGTGTGTGNSTSPSVKDKHHKFVKAPSLARLLGNTYNTKKSENELMNSGVGSGGGGGCTGGRGSGGSGRRGGNNFTTPTQSVKNSLVNGAKRFTSNTERFQKCSKEDIMCGESGDVSLQNFREDRDISTKAFRTISRSLGKLWWKRTHSVDISAPDPEYKVSYLGNVLTGWAKGEGCIEKPLNTLWRNYTQNHKPDVIMRIKICASGLKATTRQHGLTEYWANRITYCCAPQNYPKVFCWIYRHEGRKLKHELRCHAVLCSKEAQAQDICATLRENLDRALREFKREKISKQNARLSLANSVYENPSLPRRKILLSVGGNNYRPPLERSKSAPKLMAIEEAIGEEDGEDAEETNEPEMPSCCQKDSLYPAMTLGRRRCRRGHSIRRTGKIGKAGNCCMGSSLNHDHCESRQLLETNFNLTKETSQNEQEEQQDLGGVHQQEQLHKASHIFLLNNNNNNNNNNNDNEITKDIINNVYDESNKTKSTSSLGSDEDDLDKVLNYHNYDTNSPLAGELLSYFDMKIKPKTSSLSNLSHHNGCDDDDDDDETKIIFEPSLVSDPLPRSSISLDNLDNCSENEDDDGDVDDDCANDVYDDYVDEEYFRQSAILNLLHSNSLRRMANLSINSDDNSIESMKSSNERVEQQQQHEHQHHQKQQHQEQQQQQQQQQQQHHHQHFDSDDGSISSGCETASTVTANMDDGSLKYNPTTNHQHNHYEHDQTLIVEQDHHQQQQQQQQQQEQQQQQQINPHQKSNETNEIKICNASLNLKLTHPHGSIKGIRARYNRKDRHEADVSDSEFSDESGFVEFQEHNVLQRNKTVTV